MLIGYPCVESCRDAWKPRESPHHARGWNAKVNPGVLKIQMLDEVSWHGTLRGPLSHMGAVTDCVSIRFNIVFMETMLPGLLLTLKVPVSLREPGAIPYIIPGLL